MRKYEVREVSPEAFGRLVDRVDVLQARTTGLQRRHDQLDEKLQAIVRTQQTLAETVTEKLGQVSCNNSSGGDSGGGGGQRDWFAVPSVDVGLQWLEELSGWLDRVWRWMVTEPLPQCWPWHPAAVAELLAIQAQWEAVYAANVPSGVVDVLGRWLPGAKSRVLGELRACNQYLHRGNQQVDREAVPALVEWWVTSREGDPPGLTPTL